MTGRRSGGLPLPCGLRCRRLQRSNTDDPLLSGSTDGCREGARPAGASGRDVHVHHRGPSRARRSSWSAGWRRSSASACVVDRDPVWRRACGHAADLVLALILAVDRADRRRPARRASSAGRAAALPYRGPSPFLVFAASIPVSVLRSSSRRRSRSSAVGRRPRWAARGAALGRHPGDRLHRARPAAGRRHRRARLASDGRPRARTAARSAEIGRRGALGVPGHLRDRRSVAQILLPVSSRSSRSARCHRPGPPSASSCRSWPACSSRRSARRSSSAGSPRPPGCAGMGAPAALVARGRSFFAFAHVLTVTRARPRAMPFAARGRRVRGAAPGRVRARLAVPPAAARSGRRSGCTPGSTGSCWSSPRPSAATI